MVILVLTIVDQNGDFNPTNPLSPYAPDLTPMKKVQITATYGATTYPIFSGFITSYVNTQPKDATEVAYTTIQAVDAFRLANNAAALDNLETLMINIISAMPAGYEVGNVNQPQPLEVGAGKYLTADLQVSTYYTD